MHHWNNLLYVGILPKTETETQKWLRDLEASDIDAVLALTTADKAPMEGKERPEWRERIQDNEGSPLLPIGFRQVRLEELAVDPSLQLDRLGTHELWEQAFSLANSIAESAHIGIFSFSTEQRALALAAAILMVLGRGAEDAIRELNAQGMPQFSTETRKFLAKGIPEPIEKHMYPDDDYDTTGKQDEDMSSVLNVTEEQLDAFQEFMEAPDNFNRHEFQELQQLRATHRTLEDFGLRSILDPAAESWHKSASEEKKNAFQMAFRHLKTRWSSTSDRFNGISLAVLLGMIQPVRSYAPLPLSSQILAATMMAQAAIDADYEIPSQKETVTQARERYEKLLDGRKLKSVETRLERAGVARLGREELDSGSAEGEQTALDDKITALQNIVDAGIPLLDAVMLYQHRYRDDNRRYILEQLPADLFALAGVIMTADS